MGPEPTRQWSADAVLRYHAGMGPRGGSRGCHAPSRLRGASPLRGAPQLPGQTQGGHGQRGHGLREGPVRRHLRVAAGSQRFPDQDEAVRRPNHLFQHRGQGLTFPGAFSPAGGTPRFSFVSPRRDRRALSFAPRTDAAQAREEGTLRTFHKKEVTPRTLYRYKFYSETHLCSFCCFLKKFPL